ncbi:MAG TPA: hypothetical protein PK156_29760 [Polyangium sp.]|nr:hypothetical protein [Polyangium sp.]
MKCFLPPRVGRKASFQLARPLHVVARISLAAEETSAYVSENIESALPTLERASSTPGTMAP